MRMSRRRYAYTYGDYLMLEAEAPTLRHEFIDGEIVAMAGGSELHSALIAALSGELYAQLRGTTCGLRESNLRVRIQATGNAFYADALVVCGKSEVVREIRGGDSLLNPSVIVEVLSRSTEDYDRGGKFDDDYRFIPSLREYVLVAQDEELIEVRSRADDGNWTTRVYGEGQHATIGATLDVDGVYREAKRTLCDEGPLSYGVIITESIAVPARFPVG
jgi:Uma2 family endonuclease